MIYSQDDRVFMRSLATRGQAGGLSPETQDYLKRLRALPFDVILVETVGTGQEAMPFREGLVDQSVFVMSPEYGSQLQLQKIAMLDLADVVVVNKSDMAGAPRASAEVSHRIDMNHRGQRCSRPAPSATATRAWTSCSNCFEDRTSHAAGRPRRLKSLEPLRLAAVYSLRPGSG